MTNDLVTRLRALADLHYPAKLTVVLREAADALEETTRKLNHESYCHDKAARGRTSAETERDAIKAKLAGASALLEHARDCHVETAKRAEKAEAEAAALRKVLRDFSHNWDCDTGANECHHDHCRACAAKRALSQPGPGAALLERVKKLEAVAALSEVHVKNGGMANAQRLADALAVLDAPCG